MKNVSVLLVGFGNIGRSVLESLPSFPDIRCVGIVSRRAGSLREKAGQIGVGPRMIYDLVEDKDQWLDSGADVAILCGGSKEDLPKQGPYFARFFSTVCSFDTHDRIGDYIAEDGSPVTGYYYLMDAAARQSKNVALICQGWDPGVFSNMRALFSSCLGKDAAIGAFYGLTEAGGLSMGHSDALRQIPGIKDARQYTHAKQAAIEAIRSVSARNFMPRDKHWRECFVVAEDGADRAAIEQAIKAMPDYFEPFETTVKFITQEELDRDHSSLAHDGLVIGANRLGTMEYRNSWGSNPLGTAGILLAYTRAAFRMKARGESGAMTPLDVPTRLLLPDPSIEEALRLV